MTEIFEYLLVVAVSSALAGSSLMLLHGSVPLLGQVEADAQFNQVVAAANIAVIRSSEVTGVFPMDNVSLSCTGGQITFVSQGQDLSSSLGADCSFRFRNLSCLCTLSFRPLDGMLDLQVQR